MARRRSRGEGTIYQRPDGLWSAQITMPDGKKRTKNGKLQKDVREWLRAQREELKDGLLATDETLTVSNFFDRFLKDTLAYKIRANTLESYSEVIRLHVKPTIGHLKLIELRPYHLQDLYKQKKESGLSNRRVQYIHAIIHRGLEQAYKWGLVVRNIADLAVPPRPARKELNIFTIEQCRLLLQGVKDDRLYPFYAVAIGCGLRLGEILALHWEDINFENSTLSVKRTLQKVNNKGRFGEPKSKQAKRSVAMPGFVLNALKNRKDSGLIFATSNGTPFSHRNIHRHFKKTLVKLGLPEIRFHDLRHTFASILASQNVHPKTVQEALGHSTITLTLDTYSHILPGMQKEAAEKLNSLLL